MPSIASPEISTTTRGLKESRHARAPGVLVALWIALFVTSLFSPAVFDDADGTHANAARHMALSGDLVTLRVNNVRYLEKAPLPYWIVAASIRIFGCTAFAVHLPQAIAVLLLALLGYRWSREAFGERAALYTGLGVLTSAGVFLFTRVFIPDVLLSLLLATALYCFLHTLDDPPLSSRSAAEGSVFRASSLYPYAMWAALALAVLTKGLVAIVFLFGTVALYLALTGEYRNWRRLRPLSGLLLFFAVAAPWHILAGLRNTGGMNGHGFFWFYFVNEHFLRFLGRRYPVDYNKLPAYLYWTLHLVWLFPWSLFLPLTLIQFRNAWRHPSTNSKVQPDRLEFHSAAPHVRHSDSQSQNLRSSRRIPRLLARLRNLDLPARTTLLLATFSALVLLFFSLSTNQEYYTFPAYLPLLILIAAALARAEKTSNLEPPTPNLAPAITFAHAALTTLGILIAAALAFGLWTSRHLTAAPNVGDLLAHRGVGDYTLSMSALFDLTGPSFAALRLPASLAMAAFGVGPVVAWILRSRRRHVAATTAIALTSATFLIAAHIALTRFAPMLSSQDFAAGIQQLESTGAISHDNTLLLYGDQAYGSSIPFYLDAPLSHPALLVDGRSSSMLFGGTFTDSQGLFLTKTDLLAQWGTGPRKLLFIPINHRDDVDHLLGQRQIILQESSGKILVTDRPLDTPSDPLH